MTARPDTWSGTLVLGRGIVVYVGPGSVADTHHHDAIQLIWSPHSPIIVGTTDGSITTHAALVASRRTHHVAADGAHLGIVLIEPSGRLGRRLDAIARSSPTLIDLQFAPNSLPDTTDVAAVIGWGRELVASVTGDSISISDEGVRPELHEASRFIDAHLHHAPLLADTARHTGLSPRQLRRSFADDIGMPYRRYVLWRRLRIALLAVHDGNDLTTAAAAAGFADSAHFSRTFRQTFGLTPAKVLPLLTVAETDFTDT